MGDDSDLGGVDVDDVARLWARVAETEGLERASVLDELGGALLEADREGEAVAVVEASRAIYAAAGDDAEVARCDRNLGLLLLGTDRAEDALARYEAACATYDALLMSSDAAGCRQAMAELAAGEGRPLDALLLLDRAAGAFAEAGDGVRSAWCRFDAAATMLELDDLAGATEALEEARRLFRGERAYLFVARVDSVRAEVARQEGRFEDALALLEAARHVFRSSGSDGEVDRCDDVRAEVLIDAGRATEAIDGLEAAREERRSLGNAVGVAWCELHLSRAYDSLGRLDDAESCRCSARAVFDAAGLDEVLHRAELQSA